LDAPRPAEKFPVKLLFFVMFTVFLTVISSVYAMSADDYYNQGMALARAKRYAEAKQALSNGQKQAPNDQRFPIELAGIEFQQQHYEEAKKHLKRAAELDPRDSYVQQFLATVFYLQDNLDAALLHWNKINLPRIEVIHVSSPLRTKPALLDRAFAFSAASILRRDQLQESRATLDLLGNFTKYSFGLTSNSDQSFNLQFHSIERNGWGNTRIETAISLLRGLPYRTLFPEFYNWNGRAIHVLSLLRWDSDKRRLYASLSGPLQGNPRSRYTASIDGRQEDWNVPTIPNNFRLEKMEFLFAVSRTANFSLKEQPLIGTERCFTASNSLSRRS
jgi:hypothetical protein